MIYGARRGACQWPWWEASRRLRSEFDGYFGRGTETAVIDLQRAKGLAITGIAGEEVADALGLTGY